MSHRFWIVVAALALTCAWPVTSAPVLAQEAAAPEIAVPIDGTYGYNLPTDISRDGYKIDRLIHIMHWAMGLIFIAWGAFFVYCLARFRQRTGHVASSILVKAKASKYSEVAVAIFEAVVLIGLTMPVWADVRSHPPEPDENPFRVRVVAEQFAWNFHYPGEDGVFGRTAAHLVDAAISPMGLDRSDPHAQDDAVSQELHIPVNRPVIAEITSKDVIHSFSVPVLRVKQDAVPGMRIPIWFEAVKTGNYEVACAQLCGNNHYSMKALLVVQPQEDYDAWYEEMSAPAEFFDDF